MLEADQESPPTHILFQQTTVPGVPTCFYDTIPNYAASNIQYSPTGITVDLTLLTASGSAREVAPPQDTRRSPSVAAAASGPLSAKISLLNLTVIYHTENMLQFKVSPVLQVLALGVEDFTLQHQVDGSP